MSDPTDRYRPPGPDDETRSIPPGQPGDPVPSIGGPSDAGSAAPSAQPGPGATWTPDARPDPGATSAPDPTPSTTTPPWRPADDAVAYPSQPLPVAQKRSTGGPVRWIVALLVTAIVVVAVGAVALFASQTSTAAAAGLAYLPAGTVSYNELRLDLPGDQRQKVGDFLAHFPGFADRSTLDQGLEQLLDRLLKTGTKDKYSYTADIKPWFTGQLSYALLDFPNIAGAAVSGTLGTCGSGLPQPSAESCPSSTGMAIGRAIVVIGVQDKVKAQVELDKLQVDIKAAGASTSSTDRNGLQVVTVSGPSGGAGVSYALTNDALVLSPDIDDLTAALDRKTANGENLGTSATFKDNIGKLRGDRVGLTYLNTDAIRTQLASLAPAGRPGSAILSYALSKIPAVVMASLRFDSDRLVVDGINRPAQGATAGSGKASDLAKHAPADSLAYVEVADVGTFVRELVTAIKSDPAYAQVGPSVQQQVAQIEGILGSKLENYLDWLDNIAVTGGLSDGQPAVALLASVNDAATANTRLTQLTSFLQLAGGGLGVKIAQQDYAGTKLTVISLGEGQLASGLPPNAAIAFALKDATFVLGYGEAYVKKLLDLKPEASLGQAQRFADALKAAGGPATGGLVYVDLTSIRTTAESFLTGEQRDKYEKEFKPYLLPFDQLISVAAQDGTDQRTHLQLIVK